MNYRYIDDFDHLLKTVVARRPAASIHDIKRAHPTFSAMSLDHLALRLERLAHHRDPIELS